MDWNCRFFNTNPDDFMGFVLELERNYNVLTLDSRFIDAIELFVMKEFRELFQCDLTLPQKIKPLFDAAIKRVQDEIDGLIEKKEIQ
jgi:hypothetical protein